LHARELAVINNHCFSRQILDSRTPGKFLRGRVISMVSSHIRDSIHVEAITHVQRMDIRGERQRSQTVGVNPNLAVIGEIVLRLA